MQAKFKRSCLKQNKTFNEVLVVNLYIVDELNMWSYDLGTEFSIANCLFGAVTLTKNTD